MKNFELWLDESGDFNNDQNKTGRGKSPSLVGGLLIENRTFPDSFVNAIIPEDRTYHSVDENDQLERFERIVDKLFNNSLNRFVVFSNQERVMILDNNLTYLNIISEGILQLIKQLKVKYGDIFLRVVIANRVDTTTGLNPANSVVPSDVYEKRIKEKLIIGGFENSILDKEWELNTASARKDKRLMLADIVCNTFFTRHRERKFSSSEREYIENFYNDSQKTMVFTVFESLLQKEFQHNILENRIGEAVSNICISNDKSILEKSFGILREKFKTCSFYDVRFQYKFIDAFIEYYINVVRDFDVCELLLKNILDYYIPLLEEYESDDTRSLSKVLALDIKFYLLTVYTHVGNIEKAARMELECENDINNLPASIDNLNYQIKFKSRKINNMINNFEYEKALESANVLVADCREIKEMITLISNDDIVFYDELAKALGTRLQIKTFMLRKVPKLYDSAAADSDEAIDSFIRDDDKKRQYLYRVQLETEHNAYESALDFLMKSVNYSGTDFKVLWGLVQKASVFSVSAYIRLMAEGSANGWKVAEDMFSGISNSNYIESLLRDDKLFHPTEIILWKYAKYCACNDMANAAKKYYERAVEVCFAGNDITLNIIGIGIDFEYHAFLLDETKNDFVAHERDLRKKCEKIKKIDHANIINAVFGELDLRSRNSSYYAELSNSIAY